MCGHFISLLDSVLQLLLGPDVTISTSLGSYFLFALFKEDLTSDEDGLDVWDVSCHTSSIRTVSFIIQSQDMFSKNIIVSETACRAWRVFKLAALRYVMICMSDFNVGTVTLVMSFFFLMLMPCQNRMVAPTSNKPMDFF